MPRPTRIQRHAITGRHVSAKSKTGDPACSAAMSSWKTGGMTAQVAAVLGKCRAKARALKGAGAHRAAGNDLKAQRLEHHVRSGGPVSVRDRMARARELAAARHARGPRPAATAAPDRVAKAREVLSRQVPRPETQGFTLKQESARGVKRTTFESNGRGHTPYMFDMRKGDLPGQTSLLERVGILDRGGQHEALPMHTVQVPPLSGGYGTMATLTPRQKADMRRAAKDLTGETRKSAAKRLRTVRGALHAAKIDPATHTDHQPGTVTDLQTKHIHFDPLRFQYKIHQTDTSTGAVGSLAGVKRYDPELGGVLQVWKDPVDSKVYVVNGHNRLDLANRLGAERVTVRFIHAATAEDAKARGALTNIAEGRGTSVDAAKFFRSTGHTRESLESAGVPLRERVATEGIALSKLDDKLFQRVVHEELSPERAAIIGGSGLSHPQQRAVVEMVDRLPKSQHVTNEHLKELVDEVRHAPTANTKTFDLFGESADEKSLALHKTLVSSQVKQRLSREKRLFGVVSKSRAAKELERAGNQINAEESGRISSEAATTLAAFDKLKRLHGPVAKALNEAAERIHAGESKQKVTDETYRRIVRELPAFLAGDVGFAS